MHLLTDIKTLYNTDYFIIILFLLIIFSFLPSFMWFSKFYFVLLVGNHSIVWSFFIILFLIFVLQAFFLRLVYLIF